MQEIKAAVAVFCTACICAEIVSQLLEGTRLRPCIKAVAGLYILVSLFRALPGLGTQLKDFSLPEIPAASYGTLTDTVLEQAGSALASALQDSILEKTGCDVKLEIELTESQGNVSPQAVRVTPAVECSGAQQAGICSLLQEALGTAEIVFINKEDVP